MSLHLVQRKCVLCGTMFWGSKKRQFCSKKCRSQRKGKKFKGEDYQSRQIALQDLGFSSYRDYLNSELWLEIRRKVYKAKGNACFLCGLPATELHHNRYHRNDLAGKKIKYINPICRECHTTIEFQKDGSKGTVQQAKKAFHKARKMFLDFCPK